MIGYLLAFISGFFTGVFALAAYAVYSWLNQ